MLAPYAEVDLCRRAKRLEGLSISEKEQLEQSSLIGWTLRHVSNVSSCIDPIVHGEDARSPGGHIFGMMLNQTRPQPGSADIRSRQCFLSSQVRQVQEL